MRSVFRDIELGIISLDEARQDRSFGGNLCTCEATCFEREDKTADRCCGHFGSYEECECKACGDLAAEQYADGQYQGVDFGEESSD